MAARLIICRSVSWSSGCQGEVKQAMENKNSTFHNMVPSIISFQRMESQTGVVMILWQNNNLM